MTSSQTYACFNSLRWTISYWIRDMFHSFRQVDPSFGNFDGKLWQDDPVPKLRHQNDQDEL